MWIIFNRVNGEYDTKGFFTKPNCVDRSSWKELAHAKSHVWQKVTYFMYRDQLRYLEWFWDSVFIKVDNFGNPIKTISVKDYLQPNLCDCRYFKALTRDQKIHLGLVD